MTIGNHNNELNARAHRNAVRETFAEFKSIGDEMQMMLDMPTWHRINEEQYDILKERRDRIVASLKYQGMFL